MTQKVGLQEVFVMVRSEASAERLEPRKLLLVI